MTTPEAPRDWIFTFGPDNLHPVTGESLGRNFVRINGTCDGTRERMLSTFGRNWSSQYTEESGMAKVERWGWTEIPLP